MLANILLTIATVGGVTALAWLIYEFVQSPIIDEEDE